MCLWRIPGIAHRYIDPFTRFWTHFVDEIVAAERAWFLLIVILFGFASLFFENHWRLFLLIILFSLYFHWRKVYGTFVSICIANHSSSHIVQAGVIDVWSMASAGNPFIDNITNDRCLGKIWPVELTKLIAVFSCHAVRYRATLSLDSFCQTRTIRSSMAEDIVFDHILSMIQSCHAQTFAQT